MNEAGAFDTTYLKGFIHGMLLGLGEHENVEALCALYNEVLIATHKNRGEME